MHVNTWTLPKSPSTWVNAWDGFHDATLEALQSDRLGQTVELTLRLGFPRPTYPCPERIQIQIGQVQFASVFGYRTWPGYFELLDAKVPRTSPLYEGISEKARTETLSLFEFADFVKKNDGAEVLDGYYATEGEKAWLRLEGADGDEFGAWEMLIVGGLLTIKTDEGLAITPEELHDMGSRA